MCDSLSFDWGLFLAVFVCTAFCYFVVFYLILKAGKDG